MNSDYEAVIGLEVHCQLSTESKIFCSCRARPSFGRSVSEMSPNINICPVCAGHPGTLPVLNQKVVEYAIMAGLALGCQIRLKSIFARKNYFYPDLPKGYQITQHEHPICENGLLEIETLSGKKKVRIQRIHIEEDAGKNVHMGDYSLVNLNRAGIPLIEIVSSPDLQFASEAFAYLKSLYEVVTALAICDGNMQEGNFRCDANVSVKLKGSCVLGTRVEIKNVNSFRFVEKAIQYEIDRQIELILSGGSVVQETRTYDSDKGITLSMRAKEKAEDYRYFPDPDLIPLCFEQEWIDRLRSLLPELPEQKRIRYQNSFGLSAYDAGVLTSSKSLSQFFEQVLSLAVLQESSIKIVSNLLTGEVARLINEEGVILEQSKLKPSHILELVQLVETRVLSHSAAKQVVVFVWGTGEDVREIVRIKGLSQVNDISELEIAISKVIVAFPNQVLEYRSGKEKLLGFLVGQVMKETSGKANPSLLNKLLKEKLNSLG